MLPARCAGCPPRMTPLPLPDSHPLHNSRRPAAQLASTFADEEVWRLLQHLSHGEAGGRVGQGVVGMQGVREGALGGWQG